MKILKLLIAIVNSIIPKKNKRVIFKSVPDFTGNAKAFSDYLIRKKPEYELIWLIDNCKYDYKQSRIKTINKSTFRAVYYYLTSKYIITTHNEMIGTKGCNQKYISLWHGMPFKKICYLGEFDHKGMESYSSFRIATSEIMRSVISACFRENANNVRVTGQPRNDFLFDNKVSLSNLGIDGNFEKIILYAPTFRENHIDARYSDGEPILGNNFLRVSDFDFFGLESFLQKNKILLLLKLHPFEEKSLKGVNLGSNIKSITADSLIKLKVDINHILSFVDILISDYSSIFYDFLVLNKPIIFLVPDFSNYCNARGGFVLEPFESWSPGEKVFSQIGLINEIKVLLSGKDNYFEMRHKVNLIINKYTDNLNCERVFTEFFD